MFMVIRLWVPNFVVYTDSRLLGVQWRSSFLQIGDWKFLVSSLQLSVHVFPSLCSMTLPFLFSSIPSLNHILNIPTSQTCFQRSLTNKLAYIFREHFLFQISTEIPPGNLGCLSMIGYIFPSSNHGRICCVKFPLTLFISLVPSLPFLFSLSLPSPFFFSPLFPSSSFPFPFSPFLCWAGD